MKEILTNIEELSNEIQGMVPADDNIKLEMAQSYDLIQTMKLSLLIDACRHSGKIINYLKTSSLTFPLPYPLAECDPEHLCLQRGVSIIFGKINEKCHLNIDRDYSTMKMVQYGNYQGTNGTFQEYRNVPEKIQDAYFAKYPLFQLFKKISPYNTIEKAYHFFGISSLAFDPIAKGLYRISPTIFHSTAHEDKAYWESFRSNHPNWKEEEFIEYDLDQILTRKPNQQCNDLYSEVVGNADQKQVYDYQNAAGLTVMKMIKKYNYTPKGTSKAYIPLTNWMFHGEADDQLFTVPIPDIQPLYNLQYFHESDYVVICPNIEIADKLQRNSNFQNVVFTSFVCNHGYFSQVDFSELENKKVVLLIVNHSGMEIEDAVVESKALYIYLEEQEKKLKYTELCVIQTAVKYHLKGEDIHNMREYVNKYQTPTPITKSTFVFNTEDDYNENYEAAVKRIEMRNLEVKPYWVKDTDSETENNESSEDDHSNGPEQLMRGIIARGCITYIIGESGIGKTSLTASICAYLVNNSQRARGPFSERFWTRCKIKSDYERLKIVHLDFDNDQSYIKKRETEFVDPYMPDDSEKRAECKANYIVVSMYANPINYSEEENFP